MNLQAKVDEKLNEVWNKAISTFPTLAETKKPGIEYSNRMKRCGGTAYYRQNRIRLNAKMLLQNGLSFIDEVVPHEVCHIVEYAVFKTHGHGTNFYRVGKVLGYKLARYHKFLPTNHRNAGTGYISMDTGPRIPTSNAPVADENSPFAIKQRYLSITKMLERYENLFDEAKRNMSSNLEAVRAEYSRISTERNEMQQKYGRIIFARA